jgi:hypothetical protein
VRVGVAVALTANNPVGAQDATPSREGFGQGELRERRLGKRLRCSIAITG